MLLQDVTLSRRLSKDKKTALETWMACEEATETLLVLSHAPQKLDDDNTAVLERYTILLYDRPNQQPG